MKALKTLGRIIRGILCVALALFVIGTITVIYLSVANNRTMDAMRYSDPTLVTAITQTEWTQQLYRIPPKEWDSHHIGWEKIDKYPKKYCVGMIYFNPIHTVFYF